jgi:hypothetical protein
MFTSTLRLSIAAALFTAAMLPVAQAADISVSINQPGVYGRVLFGEPIPQGSWVNPQPIIVTQPQYNWQREPIYLYVPPSHSSNWPRYCSRYNACGQPVTFVQDRWVRDRYEQQRGREGRDQDRDGIRNNRDGDRDGDGVPNWQDRKPKNKNRY